MRDWIQAGRAYVRAQLAADEFGLRFQLISQVLQDCLQRDELRAEVEVWLSGSY